MDTYRKIRDKGYSPKIAIDGGYALGSWTGGIKTWFPEIKVLGIDANSHIFNDGGAEIKEGCVLWSEDGVTLPFHRNSNASGWCTGDSVFKENSHHYGPNNTHIEYMTSVSLNTLCKKHGFEKVDILKLDVQGAELECLKGFSDYIDTVDFVELECSVMEYNVGAPGIYEVLEYMKSKFDIHDVLEIHYASGQYDLIQIDFLFKNRNFPLQMVY